MAHLYENKLTHGWVFWSIDCWTLRVQQLVLKTYAVYKMTLCTPHSYQFIRSIGQTCNFGGRGGDLENIGWIFLWIWHVRGKHIKTWLFLVLFFGYFAGALEIHKVASRVDRFRLCQAGPYVEEGQAGYSVHGQRPPPNKNNSFLPSTLIAIHSMNTTPSCLPPSSPCP
jgi:hypothetical protein